MHLFLLIFLILIIVLSLIITVIGEIEFKGKKVDIDSQYVNKDGDHIYYERSLIEKKLLRQKFPHITNLRTLKSLFR